MLIGRPAVKALLQQESVKKNNSFFKREIKPLEYKLTILLLRAESRLQLTNFLIKLKELHGKNAAGVEKPNVLVSAIEKK